MKHNTYDISLKTNILKKYIGKTVRIWRNSRELSSTLEVILEVINKNLITNIDAHYIPSIHKITSDEKI